MTAGGVRLALLGLAWSAAAFVGCQHSAGTTPEPGDCLGVPTGGRLSVVNATPHTADGMPVFGATTGDRVSAIVAQKQADILARCAGAVAVGMQRGPGRAWVGLNGGPYRVVDTADDYVIVVRLRSTGFIPREPITYDGVPLRFAVP